MSAGTKIFTDCACDIWGVLSAPSSTIHLWSISKAVLKVSFSFAVKKFKCETDPWLVVMVDQTSSVSLLYFWSIFFRYLFLTLNEPESVLCV